MFDSIKTLFQRHALKKCTRKDDTGLLPLSEIHTAVIILNVEDQEFNQCKDDILAFFRTYNVRPDIFFFDFRKLEKNELLLTSIQTTVLRKDLNWYGMPNEDKMNLLTSKQYDLFISLVDEADFTNTYSALNVSARFKIGRREFGDKVFDMIITGEGTVRDIFAGMKEYLLKIR